MIKLPLAKALSYVSIISIYSIDLYTFARCKLNYINREISA